LCSGIWYSHRNFNEDLNNENFGEQS